MRSMILILIVVLTLWTSLAVAQSGCIIKCYPGGGCIVICP